MSSNWSPAARNSPAVALSGPGLLVRDRAIDINEAVKFATSHMGGADSSLPSAS